MKLELYAERPTNGDMQMCYERMSETLKSYKTPLHKRIINGVTPVLLFPFEFIIICLYILMLPFITIAALIGAKFVLGGLDE